MGDFRADITLKMVMFGKTYKHNMWINYWDNGEGIDQRVVDWFADSWRDAQAKHDRIIEKATRASREKATSEFERALLKGFMNNQTRYCKASGCTRHIFVTHLYCDEHVDKASTPPALSI